MNERDSRNQEGRNQQDRDQDRRGFGDRDRQAQQWRDDAQSRGYQSGGYGQYDSDERRDRPYSQMGGADDRYSGERSDDNGRFDRDDGERATSREFSDDHRAFGPSYGGASYRSGPYGGSGGGSRLGSYGGYADRSRNFGSFTSEDQGGRDFTSRDRGFGSYGRRSSGREEYRESDYQGGRDQDGRDQGNQGGASAHPDAYATTGRDYMGDADYSSWRQAGERRGFFERAGDTIAGWFGGDDAARRRDQDRRESVGSGREDDHRGRGPSGYTRSDDRIREDANDALTHDRNVDATHITVKVEQGEVTLDGTVRDRQSKRRAEDAVEHISGVKHVQNNLRVQDSSQGSSGQASSSHNQPAYNQSSTTGQGSTSQGSAVEGHTGSIGSSSAPAASATGSSAGSGSPGASSGASGGTATAASTAQKT